MVSPHRIYLRWSTALLVLSSYLALASVSEIGPLILAIPLAALAFSPIGERLDARYAAYGVASRAVTIAYFCFLPLSWVQLGLMTAVVTLAIYIQCYTLLHQKGPRNYYHLFLMSLFLLLAACVQSPEPIIGFVMLLFLVSAVWGNIMLRVVIEEESLEKPTSIELVSLDYLKYQGQGEGSQWHAVPAMAFLLSLAIIGITAITFVLTPRMEAGILGRNETLVGQTTGLSDSVDLQAGGTISQDQTPVMMVQFPDEPDGQIENPDWLYWRVTTLNIYEGNSWRSRESRVFDPGVRGLPNQRRDSRDVYSVERSVRPGQTIVRQSIYMDDVPQQGVPTLDLVQRVEVDENTRGVELAWSSDNDYTVRLNNSGSRRLDYEVWSEPGEPSPELLRAAEADFSDMRESDYALFTGHSLGEQSVTLARQITGGQPGLYDKVAAVEQYLSGNNFLYTLNIPPMGGGSVVDVFINQTRLGHCELFATAMSLMLRSQGIPTRVVKGFRGGEWNESDQTYTIRANMAHLWVEVWFPEFGWITFDPSPRSDDLNQGLYDRLAMLASRILLKSKMFWFQEVVGFDRGAQVERLRNFTLGVVGSFRGEDEAGETARESAGGFLGAIVPLVVFGLIVAILVLLARRIRWIRLPRGLHVNRDQASAVRLYLLLRRRLQRFGVACAGKTAEELREELREPKWGAPPEALEVLDLYNTVRFGERPLTRSRISALQKAVLKLRPAEE